MTTALAVIAGTALCLALWWVIVFRWWRRWLNPAGAFTMLGAAVIVLGGGSVRVLTAEDDAERRQGAALAVAMAAASGVAVLAAGTKAKK